MPTENNIKEKLLKEMEKERGRTSVGNIEWAQEIVAKEKARIRWLKGITIFSWSVVVICFIARDIAEKSGISQFLTGDEHWWLGHFIAAFNVFVVIALVLAVLLYTKSRTLTIRQILARLSGIEEQLKKMSKDR